MSKNIGNYGYMRSCPINKHKIYKQDYKVTMKMCTCRRTYEQKFHIIQIQIIIPLLI